MIQEGRVREGEASPPGQRIMREAGGRLPRVSYLQDETDREPSPVGRCTVIDGPSPGGGGGLESPPCLSRNNWRPMPPLIGIDENFRSHSSASRTTSGVSAETWKRRRPSTASWNSAEKLVTAHPEDHGDKRKLGVICINLGNTCSDQGSFEEAERLYRRATDLSETAVNTSPADPILRAILATGLSNLGNLLRRTGRFQASEQAYRRASAIYAGLVGDVGLVGERDEHAFSRPSIRWNSPSCCTRQGGERRSSRPSARARLFTRS